MLGHLEHRQQVFHLALVVAGAVIAKYRQRVVVVGDGPGQVFGQAPGLGREIADDGMIGVEGAVLRVHDAGLLVGFA